MIRYKPFCMWHAGWCSRSAWHTHFDPTGWEGFCDQGAVAPLCPRPFGRFTVSPGAGTMASFVLLDLSRLAVLCKLQLRQAYVTVSLFWKLQPPEASTMPSTNTVPNFFPKTSPRIFCNRLTGMLYSASLSFRFLLTWTKHVKRCAKLWRHHSELLLHLCRMPWHLLIL